MTNLKTDLQASFTAALPIVLGYVAIGVPCGILCDSIGLNALQVFAMSVLFYSGAGQFMIPNMWLAGAPIASIIASVNTLKFEEGGWSVRRALFVNLFSCTSWTLSCTVGVLVGNAIGIPLAIASFAMTSIFICLLCTQKANVENVVAAAVAMLGVYVFKLVGLTGPAILLGAVAGVVAALCVSQVRLARSRESAAYEARIEEACVGGEGASKKGGERE